MYPLCSLTDETPHALSHSHQRNDVAERRQVRHRPVEFHNVPRERIAGVLAAPGSIAMSHRRHEMNSRRTVVPPHPSPPPPPRTDNFGQQSRSPNKHGAGHRPHPTAPNKPVSNIPRLGTPMPCQPFVVGNRPALCHKCSLTLDPGRSENGDTRKVQPTMPLCLRLVRVLRLSPVPLSQPLRLEGEGGRGRFLEGEKVVVDRFGSRPSAQTCPSI